MKRINLPQYLFAAALAAAISFTGCQKNEMDDVNASLQASSGQEAIAGACHDTYLGENITGAYKVRGVNQEPIAIANLEVGNNDESFLVQITLVETNSIGITGVNFKIGGNTYGASYEVEDLRTQALFEIPRHTLGAEQDGSVTVTDVVITAKPNVSNASDAKTDKLGPFIYEYKACETLVCAHEKEYWKSADNAWANFSKTGLGYSEAFLRSNLNSSANKNSVKLLQSLTVASLNAVNVSESANGASALKDAIAEAKQILANVNVEAGQDMVGKIPPGLIGRLHQIPACE